MGNSRKYSGAHNPKSRSFPFRPQGWIQTHKPGRVPGAQKEAEAFLRMDASLSPHTHSTHLWLILGQIPLRIKILGEWMCMLTPSFEHGMGNS